MTWVKFDASQIHGTRAKGDKTVPPTRWWNHLYLLLFRWRKVTVYLVPEEYTSYRVGYKPETGPARILEEPLNSRRFAVRNGFEDCVFFAIDRDGHEIILLELEQTRDDCLSSNTPLI